MSEPEEHSPRVTLDEPPPFLGTWRRVYTFVAVYLAFLIVIFYLFARAFNS